jgi:hypothetical protein
MMTTTPQNLSPAFEAVSNDLVPVWKGFSDLSPEQAAAHVDGARDAYRSALQPHVAPVSPAADAALEEAFAAGAQACRDGDFQEFRRQRQVVLKSFLHACYDGAIAGLDARTPAVSAPWLAHIRLMGKWDERRNAALPALEAFLASGAEADTVRQAVLAWFAGQVKHMAVEAAAYAKKADRDQVVLEAVEARVYLRPIRQALAAHLGEAQTQSIHEAIEALATVPEDAGAEAMGTAAQRVIDLIPFDRGAASSR